MFNVAIIGCGVVHSVHADAIIKNKNLDLSAVVDIEEDEALASSKKHGCTYYTDYTQMLRDPDIDSVHICTPNYLHKQMAIDAMESGKHVLVEKSMAIFPDDAREMIEVSEKNRDAAGCLFSKQI